MSTQRTIELAPAAPILASCACQGYYRPSLDQSAVSQAGWVQGQCDNCGDLVVFGNAKATQIHDDDWKNR